MIDADGFRANVGIILVNTKGQVLWAKRIGHDSWQFPQGGINRGETPLQAMYRELYEEVGLYPEHVEVLAVTRDWLRYRLPKRYVRAGQEPLCIGQKQKWFLCRLDDENTRYIRFDVDTPEFDDWQWVSYWYPLSDVVPFKRNVYQKALGELIESVPLDKELRA
ncbi:MULTISPECIES: RNA pyrophosphohydrolase [Moraxella]|uniref:RNA pyrophosphohydrolase n=1 Tax=Moraxella nasicaprae TaxID=2904122 RepID=A0ABY6F2I5_9GAMM|nr:MULTISPECIES: RNA pyrophosphohydrolase [Moraxella]MDO4894911.1 RNA pyrophosphohydrolase [Moraxella sp.]UXZ04299.1 RNA pyrophosphohydrolase [Moraxella nasicaprae]